MIKLLESIELKFNNIMYYISGALCLFGMFLITADVVGRYFFSYPIPGTLEVTEVLLCFIVFGPLTYLELKGEHVRILFIFEKFSTKIQFALNVFAKGIGLFLFGLMAWQTFYDFLRAFITNEHSWGATEISLWIPKMFVFLGCLLLALHFIISFGQDVVFFKQRRAKWIEEQEMEKEKGYAVVEDVG
jgi:TRAP-type transport system small permease protein